MGYNEGGNGLIGKKTRLRFTQVIQNILVSQDRDIRVWKDEETKSYSVKSAYMTG